MVQKRKAQFQNAMTSAINSMGQYISSKNKVLQVINAKLSALNPFDILKRGYSICYDREKKVIYKDAGVLRAEQEVYVKLYKGSFKSLIREVEHEE
ncbi:MAG: hypothetical protein A2Y62_22325 [Candidatus Fischerbacteria bacterium RBG_13_37_8]|uniref:Exonuclease VII large subunit C-terminal domain-containing protein n=1 Tax=Candidatus Fischerbacteria bacterium RBG_13_37_8 TaxID=1817863 RepID=A0A1F5VKX5_9BACT|nr:MAG: hypothetical protein A2Y62_22325 [Candidatus Fischerbacteria bacterium RBG_13_37_8]